MTRPPVLLPPAGAPGLHALQTALQAQVLDGHRGAPAWVSATSAGAAATRMAVYVDAYRIRLAAVLASDYPGLRALLADRFESMAGSYIEGHRSTRPSLRDYGGGLADHLARTAPWCAEPALADLARFEWALVGAFDAAAAPVLCTARLATVAADDWADLRLGLQPSVHLLRTATDAPGCWHRLVGTGSGERAPAASPSEWVVWRRDLDTRYRRLDLHEHAALTGIIAGATVGALSERLAAAMPAERAAMWLAIRLRAWCDDGLLVDTLPE